MSTLYGMSVLSGVRGTARLYPGITKRTAGTVCTHGLSRPKLAGMIKLYQTVTSVKLYDRCTPSSTVGGYGTVRPVGPWCTVPFGQRYQSVPNSVRRRLGPTVYGVGSVCRCTEGTVGVRSGSLSVSAPVVIDPSWCRRPVSGCLLLATMGSRKRITHCPASKRALRRGLSCPLSLGLVRSR